MPGNDPNILERLRRNDPLLTKLVIRDQHYCDSDLIELVAALGNNNHLLSLDISKNNITDEGAKQLLNNTQLLAVDLSNNPVSNNVIQHLNINLAKNNRAKKLLFIEQAITLAQGKRQQQTRIFNLPRELIILILLIIAKHIVDTANNTQHLCDLILDNITKGERGKRSWNTKTNMQGSSIVFFKRWTPPSEYIEQVIRYTPGYQKAINEIPGLKELITTPFTLSMLKKILPFLQERYHQKAPFPLSLKRITKAQLYDTFIQQHFAEQEQLLKHNPSFSAERDIKQVLWKYAKSLAQAMHRAKLKIIIYTDINETSKTNNSSNIYSWKQFIDRENPRLLTLQSACLIHEIRPNQFAFIDESLLDYFVSCSMFDELAQFNKITVTPRKNTV